MASVTLFVEHFFIFEYAGKFLMALSIAGDG